MFTKNPYFPMLIALFLMAGSSIAAWAQSTKQHAPLSKVSKQSAETMSQKTPLMLEKKATQMPLDNQAANANLILKEEEIIIKKGKYKVAPTTKPTNTANKVAQKQLVQDGVGFSHNNVADDVIRRSPIGNLENLTAEQVTQRCNQVLADAKASEDLKQRAKSILAKMNNNY